MKETATLYALQQIDTQAAALAKTINQLRADHTHEQQAQQLQQEWDNESSELRAQQKLLKEKTHQEEVWQAKAKELNSKLYGGRVSNPKELAGFEAELAALNDKIRLAQDELLLLMEEVETRETSHTKREPEFKKQLRDANQAQAAVQRQIGHLTEQLRELVTKRQRQSAAIEPRLLKYYEDLRGTKHGVAVAKIAAGKCEGCHVALTDHKIQEAKAPGITTCATCSRILYAGH